jgi:branched-chain amino acid transport system ATP-binding protein
VAVGWETDKAVTEVLGVLDVRHLSVRYGAFEAVREVSLSVGAGEIVGLIGPNGAGKTSVIDAVSGMCAASGTVRLRGATVHGEPPHERARRGLARTFQSLELFEDLTVAENLAVAAEATGGGAGDRSEAVQHAATIAGLPELLDAAPAGLTHAQRKRVALARALVSRPDVVLLDEPAGGLDAAERAELASVLRRLAESGTGILLVDHDLALVMDVCQTVYVLDLGRIVAAGPVAEVRADPAVSAAYLGTTTVRGRAGAERGWRGGDVVLQARHASVGYGAVPVVRDLELQVREGEVVALLGANGAGKTTTLAAVSGMLPLTSGRIEAVGLPVARNPAELARRGVAHAPQDRGVLASLTARENLRLAARFHDDGVDAAVARLPALGALLDRRAGDLSGGEQQLLSVGRVLAAQPRVLLLDELSLGLAAATVDDVVTAVLDAAAEGAGVLVVEQHPALALSIADRAYVLQRGRVVMEGSAADIAARRDDLEAAYLG